MADTNWVDKVTVFTQDWTQDVNNAAYRGKSLVFDISTGPPNVFTVTKSASIKQAFEPGDDFEFDAHQSNTAGTATFKFVTSLGELSAPISYASSTTLRAGAITSGQIIKLTYDGINMQLPYPGAAAIGTTELQDRAVTYAKFQVLPATSLLANPDGTADIPADTPVMQPLGFLAGNLVDNTPLAQCRLSLVAPGGNLILERLNGKFLWITDRNQVIPEVGITHTITSASANTAYYIYAFIDTGTGLMLLERSVTVPDIDANGMPIKTGDATRTLVGMAYTDNPAAWVDDPTKRWVLSYWNRVEKGMLNSFSANRATASATYAEVNTEIRTQFISWADECVKAWCDGSVSGSANNVRSSTSLGLDSTTVAQDCENNAQQGNADADLTLPVSVTLPPHTVSEAANHYLTVLGKTSAGTSTWGGSATAGARTALKGTVIG